MCPSTEAAGADSEFATDVLRKLLQYIAVKNNEGRYTFLISHAWTEGPMMYLVYKAPPSDITWGLARDTRESMINPSPWQNVDEAVLYYYMLDFEEDWPGSWARQPVSPTLSDGSATHGSVCPNACQTSPRHTGTRHRQKLRPRNTLNKKIRPTSHITHADTRIHHERFALWRRTLTLRASRNHRYPVPSVPTSSAVWGYHPAAQRRGGEHHDYCGEAGWARS
jgi:hypothetical protein